MNITGNEKADEIAKDATVLSANRDKCNITTGHYFGTQQKCHQDMEGQILKFHQSSTYKQHVSTQAVSYTHLDVYKRQRYNRSPS